MAAQDHHTASALRPSDRAARRLAIFSAANLGVVVAIEALERLVGGWPWVGVVLTYPPQALWLAPSIGFGVVAAAWRRLGPLAWNAAAAALVLFGLMGLNWRSPAQDPGGPVIRIMTYNIAAGTVGIGRVLDDISRQNPDIIALQEVSASGRCPHPFEAVAAAFPTYHARRWRELAVFSRFPITGSKIAVVPSRPWRESLATRIAAPGGPITIVNTHIGTGDFMRYSPGRETQTAVALAAAAAPPLVVLGDLNSPPHGPAYGRLRRFGRDAFATAGRGLGYTYSANHPLLRIDHIFVGPGLRVLRAWTPETHGSDHRPVVADIAR